MAGSYSVPNLRASAAQESCTSFCAILWVLCHKKAGQQEVLSHLRSLGLEGLGGSERTYPARTRIECVAPLYTLVSTSTAFCFNSSAYFNPSGASKSHSAMAIKVLGLNAKASVGAKQGETSQLARSALLGRYLSWYHPIRPGVRNGESLEVAHIVSTVAVLSITGTMRSWKTGAGEMLARLD